MVSWTVNEKLMSEGVGPSAYGSGGGMSVDGEYRET